MALEALIITVKAVGHEPINAFLSECPVGCAERVWVEAINGEIFIRQQSEVATDVMFGWVCEFDLGEGTGADRKVICGVSPASKTMDRIGVQYSAVVYISSI